MQLPNRLFDLRSETGVLHFSIALTTLVAGMGLTFGLISRSTAIAFDGIYSLIDLSMSVLMLMVVRLISRFIQPGNVSKRLRERFSYGFWHLEPMLLVLNGTLLMGAAMYALVSAVLALLDQGRPVAFGMAVVYAVVTLVICLTAAAVTHHANKRIDSQFLHLDVKTWLMSSGITAALLIAFVLGLLLEGTQWEWMQPYIDPAILTLVCLLILPLPLGPIRQGLADIFRVTPQDLKQQIDAIASVVVDEYGFLSYRAYVARMGRETEIALYFIVPPDYPMMNIPQWDALRNVVSDRIGDRSPHRWLTIAFTADPEWAE